MNQLSVLSLLAAFGRPARPVDLLRFAVSRGAVSDDHDEQVSVRVNIARSLLHLLKWGMVARRKVGRSAFYDCERKSERKITTGARA